MMCLYLLGGDMPLYFFFMILFYLCSCMIYIMRLFMVYVFYFMFCENKEFILVYLYFLHNRLWFV